MKMYLALMQEVIIRLDAMAVISKIHTIPRKLVIEICYLELRLLCEVIALGCLVAHGDIKLSKKIENTYEADKIILALGKLKPHFYPQACLIELQAPGRKSVTVTEADPSKHLSKEKLIALWRYTGDVLHRSPLRKFREAKRNDRADFAAINAAGHSIVSLLQSHWIVLTPTVGLRVVLKDGTTGQPLAQLLSFSPGSNIVSMREFKLV